MHPALAHGGRIASRTADEEVFNVGHIIEYFILSPLVVQQTRLYICGVYYGVGPTKSSTTQPYLTWVNHLDDFLSLKTNAHEAILTQSYQGSESEEI
ncbi:predicted protein [Sclerotinia sclerotiorum 1980 UF-70]|uniref:Uncharacterized protein n=1 Tax=Sclerotinia sclerotiorum (strain ATCC 18683 / 1980 / Ss-1) TaxID=665079 RepID=A7EXI0_SCLS1|nr:predicted protein [Sclerotinia sclerotiorum 1980 UF-70]EDN94172.1 predicted protein [Sclerotinia sclerotiorum 1980 UF-70]